MTIDTTRWSGEGTFTQTMLDRLKTVEEIAGLKVEDAPASRSDADYNFVSNEIFVVFAETERREVIKRLGIFPATRRVSDKAMTMNDLHTLLATADLIGPADYADEGMIQYLRTERIIPPYQSRGYKLVELVRIYEAGTAARK